MNTLPPAGQDAWRLPRHAHLVVYEERERGLVTIYDCRAAQAPPSAQFLGSMAWVTAEADREETPAGYTLGLCEPAVLRREAPDSYVVEPA